MRQKGENNQVPNWGAQKYEAPPNKMWPQQRGAQDLCTAALAYDDKVSRNGTAGKVKVIPTDGWQFNLI